MTGVQTCALPISKNYISPISMDALSNLCSELDKNNWIKPNDYQKYHVKRGLRNEDGTGVMAGLTRICSVEGYYILDGERIPKDGKLSYRGYDINDIVNGCINEGRFGFEEVVWLLLFGDLPTESQLEGLREVIGECRELPDEFVEDMIMKHASKDIMNKELASTIDHFLSNTSKKGLFICGPSGCGKSTLAGFLTRSLAKQGYHLGYVHFPTYLIDLKNSFNEFGNDNNIEELRNVDYLVIDDLGGENVTGWSRDEVLAAVLTYRNQNKKITLFTSQYTQDDLIKIYTLKKDAREKIKVERLLNTIFTMSMPIMIKQ